MPIIGWLVLGLVAGFTASKLVNKTGEGLIVDILLGIAGAFVFYRQIVAARRDCVPRLRSRYVRQRRLAVEYDRGGAYGPVQIRSAPKVDSLTLCLD